HHANDHTKISGSRPEPSIARPKCGSRWMPKKQNEIAAYPANASAAAGTRRDTQATVGRRPAGIGGNRPPATVGAVAVQAQPTLDAARLREDFPIIEQRFHGKPLAYLNSAATSQKPRQVLDAMTEFYETSYGSVHRGVYALGERATAGLEGAREKVRAFVNASTEREIIFVRNATEGLNLVAYAYGLARLKPGDVVLATQLEHHSNFVPWQYVANRTGATFRIIPIDDNGDPRLDELGDVEN